MTPIEPTMLFGSRWMLVGRGRQPVAARGRDVLDEGVHRHAALVGEPADARGDQARLRRRLPPGELIASATAFGRPRRNAASTSGASAASVSAGAAEARPGADHAFEAQHGHAVAAPQEEPRDFPSPRCRPPPRPPQA